MTYFKSAMKTLASLIAFGTITYGTLVGINKLSNNNKSVQLHYHSVTEGVGAFNHIKLTRINNTDDGYRKDEVEYKFRGRFRDIIDGGAYGQPDGLVDEIIILGSEYQLGAIRVYDYNEYKSEFDDADKLLKETKKRFWE